MLVDDVWLKDGLIVCEGFLPGSNPKGTLPMLTLTNSGYNKVRPLLLLLLAARARTLLKCHTLRPLPQR